MLSTVFSTAEWFCSWLPCENPSLLLQLSLGWQQGHCREGAVAVGGSQEKSTRSPSPGGDIAELLCRGVSPHHTQQQDTHRRLLQQRGKPSLRTDKCRDNLNPPSIGVISADGVDPIRLCISVRVVWWNLGKIQELRKQPEEWKSVFFWSFSDTYWKPKKSTQIPLKLIP